MRLWAVDLSAPPPSAATSCSKLDGNDEGGKKFNSAVGLVASGTIFISMCRLVGIVASDVTEFGLVLKEAPRSLARLSREHPDGWGIAAHGGPGTIPPPSEDAAHHGVWRVYK